MAKMKRLLLSAQLLITSPVWAEPINELSFGEHRFDWWGLLCGFFLIGMALNAMVNGKFTDDDGCEKFDLLQSENPKLFLCFFWAFVIAGVLVGFNGRWLFGGDPPHKVLAQETVANISLPKGGLQDYRKPLIVMYSLTTCGYCTLMRRNLLTKDIPFIEYFVDKEPMRETELRGKLERAGLSSRNFGTPTLEVNGIMLPNNPSMKTVLKHLQRS